MGRRRDEVDAVMEAWGKVRRQLLGITQPVRGSDYIGMPRCTLASRRDLHAGSRSVGKVSQHFPEVWPPELVAVNRAIKQAPDWAQEIADWHYAIRHPREWSARARAMNLTLDEYWDRLQRMKFIVEPNLYS